MDRIKHGFAPRVLGYGGHKENNGNKGKRVLKETFMEKMRIINAYWESGWGK